MRIPIVVLALSLLAVRAPASHSAYEKLEKVFLHGTTELTAARLTPDDFGADGDWAGKCAWKAEPGRLTAGLLHVFDHETAPVDPIVGALHEVRFVTSFDRGAQLADDHYVQLDPQAAMGLHADAKAKLAETCPRPAGVAWTHPLGYELTWRGNVDDFRHTGVLRAMRQRVKPYAFRYYIAEICERYAVGYCYFTVKK